MPAENRTIEPPEWAGRLVTVNEWARITREHRSTVYRKVAAGIYPALIDIGGHKRLPGWGLWELVSRADMEAA